MNKLCFMIAVLLCSTVILSGCEGTSPLVGSQLTGSQTSNGIDNSKETQLPGISPTEEQPQNITPDLIIEPEQLISKAEAEQILGEEVKDGKKSEQDVVGQKICFYDSASADSYLQISITQQSFFSNDFNTPNSIYASLKDALDTTKQEHEVSGIGDEYFWGTPGLNILINGYYLCIIVNRSDDDQSITAMQQTGELAVKNLNAILDQ